MIQQKRWDLLLNDDEPSMIPIPEGVNFIINQFHVESFNSKFVTIELIADTIRMDKLDDDDDEAVTKIDNIILATIFPKNPDFSCQIPFSQYNRASLKAFGGKVFISGIFEQQNEFENY